MTEQLSFNAQFVFYSSLAGVIGALAMTFILSLFSRVGWTRANLVVALGDLFVRDGKNAVIVGCLVHCLGGVVFAMMYATVFMFLDLHTFVLLLAAGHLLGWGHGIVMSLIFVAGTAIYNPVGDLRKVQFAGGPAYFVAHMVYGTLVGLVIGLSPLLTGGS